jgi:hypothetical protein
LRTASVRGFRFGALATGLIAAVNSDLPVALEKRREPPYLPSTQHGPIHTIRFRGVRKV